MALFLASSGLALGLLLSFHNLPPQKFSPCTFVPTFPLAGDSGLSSTLFAKEIIANASASWSAPNASVNRPKLSAEIYMLSLAFVAPASRVVTTALFT